MTGLELELELVQHEAGGERSEPGVRRGHVAVTAKAVVEAERRRAGEKGLRPPSAMGRGWTPPPVLPWSPTSVAVCRRGQIARTGAVGMEGGAGSQL